MVTITALSFVLSASYERNTLRILEESHRELLSQVTYGFNSLDTEARTFASSLMLDNRVIPLLLGQDLDIWEIVKALNLITMRVHSVSFVDSVYIYNQRTNTFYTTMGRGILAPEDFFDAEISRMVVSRTPVEKLQPIPRHIERRESSRTAMNALNVYTYVLYESWPAQGGFPASLIVNVPVSSLLANLDTLSQGSRGEGSRIFVVGPDGRVVADARTGEFLKDLSRDPLVRRILGSRDGSGSFLAAVEGRPSVVTWVSSGPSRWRFIEVTPYSSLMRPLAAQRTLIAVICVVFLAAALLLSFLFSRLLYLPIGELVSHVRRVLDSSDLITRSVNEMRFLSEAFSHTAGMVRVLQRFKDDNMRTLRAEFLRNLLAGSLPADDPAGKAAELGLRLSPGGIFHVVACRPDHPGDASRRDGGPGEEVRTYVLEHMTQALTGVRFDCETVETDRGHLAVVISSDAAGGGDQERILHDHVRSLQGYLRDTLAVSLSAGVSDAGMGMGCLPALHAQARDLLAYRLVFGRGCIVLPADVAGRGGIPYRFPIEKERRLLDSLKAGEGTAARALFLETAEEVSLQQYETIRLTLTRLASSIFDLLTMMEENSILRFPVRFSAFMADIDGAETMEEVREAFLALFERIEAAQKSQITNKPERNIQAVREIIDARYGDCTLSAAGIAQTMRMSPVYLGKLFRDHCGQSISEYLTAVRMEKCRELLGEDACTVKEIARRVGIDNPRFLFTKFKSLYGVTPTQYRLRRARAD
jgi:two-component system, response regulator YesN